MRVGADMNVEQKRLAVLDEAVGVLQVGFALADRFDFSSAEGDAGFDFFKEKVVMAGGPVLRGVSFSRGHGVARTRRFLGSGTVGLNDHVAGLARHWGGSLSLHPSIGADA